MLYFIYNRYCAPRPETKGQCSYGLGQLTLTQTHLSDRSLKYALSHNILWNVLKTENKYMTSYTGYLIYVESQKETTEYFTYILKFIICYIY